MSSSKMITYAQLDDDEFEYSMRNRHRGKVILINNYRFSKLRDRNFSGLDRDALMAALRFVGFRQEDIELHENKTTDEMIFISRKAAEQDYSTAGCLFLIVLTHGDDSALYGSDGQAIRTEDFLMPIRAASTATLEGIPKILLIQACDSKVGSYQHPYNLQPHIQGPRPMSRLTADDSRLTHDAAIYGPAKPYSTASRSDVLIAYSTLPGTPGGSRFIQAFCEVMRRDGRREEVTIMFAKAARLMSYTQGTSVPDKNMPHPCVISELRKRLYFS